MEGDGAMESLQTREFATRGAVQLGGNLGAKDEIIPGGENVVILMIQNGTNVLRAKGTVTLMQVVLEVLSVDVTTAGGIIVMPHLRMTAAPLVEA